MTEINYLMESDEEAIRLVRKTDLETIIRQARWAGIQPGMRVADIGCGPGMITSALHELAAPGGNAIGIDGSDSRLEYARKHYGSQEVEYICRNILEPLDDIGTFDFIWIRFVLEYYRTNGFTLLENIVRILNPGGILLLIDLDHNPLNHYGLPDRLNNALEAIMRIFEEKYNFDPFMGRKLYSYMYDLGLTGIDVDVSINSLVFGELGEIDSFNWMKKIQAIPRYIDYDFAEYEGGYEEFVREFETCMNDPRRFSYVPLICCRGQKPVD